MDQSDRHNPALDVTSELFDPELCLSVSDPSLVRLPYPNIEELRHFQESMQLVPPAVAQEIREAIGIHEGKSEEQKQRDAEKKAFLCQRAAEYMKAVRKAGTIDPIETIVKRVRKGPLMLLKRAYYSKCEIDITTRHARGIRGVIRATLHGFDKFMNMLLADASEIFVVRQRVARTIARCSPSESHRTGHGEEKVGVEADNSLELRTRYGWKQVMRRRTLARVLLRGDQVVTVTFAQGSLKLPSCLNQVTAQSTSVEVKDVQENNGATV